MDGADLMKLYDDPQESIHESLALINVYNQAGPPITHAMAVVTKEMKYISLGLCGRRLRGNRRTLSAWQGSA